MTGPVNIRQAAAERWVARMDAGDLSAQDQARLEAWLAQDDRNPGVLLRTHAAWLSLDQTRAVLGQVEDGQTEEKVAAAPQWHRRKILIGAMAASVTAVIARFTLLPSPLKYVTNVGEVRRVPLADGSAMTMNSGTVLAVSMEHHARHVDLAQGEAWFEVAKDPGRPFVVAAGRIRTQAVGTAFSVRKREAGVEVLVTEGVVETWSDRERGQRIRLTAGERLLITDNAVIHYGPAQLGSVERALAWRTGMISLSGTTLADAADEFNRYNQRQLLVIDPEVAAEQMAGQFRFNDLEGFAMAVKNSFNLHIDMSNPAYIKLSRSGQTVES